MEEGCEGSVTLIVHSVLLRLGSPRPVLCRMWCPFSLRPRSVSPHNVPEARGRTRCAVPPHPFVRPHPPPRAVRIILSSWEGLGRCEGRWGGGRWDQGGRAWKFSISVQTRSDFYSMFIFIETRVFSLDFLLSCFFLFSQVTAANFFYKEARFVRFFLSEKVQTTPISFGFESLVA